MSVLKSIVTQSISVCTTMKSVLFEAMIPTVLPSHSVAKSRSGSALAFGWASVRHEGQTWRFFPASSFSLPHYILHGMMCFHESNRLRIFSGFLRFFGGAAKFWTHQNSNLYFYKNGSYNPTLCHNYVHYIVNRCRLTRFWSLENSTLRVGRVWLSATVSSTDSESDPEFLSFRDDARLPFAASGHNLHTDASPTDCSLHTVAFCSLRTAILQSTRPRAPSATHAR